MCSLTVSSRLVCEQKRGNVLLNNVKRNGKLISVKYDNICFETIRVLKTNNFNFGIFEI